MVHERRDLIYKWQSIISEIPTTPPDAEISAAVLSEQKVVITRLVIKFRNCASGHILGFEGSTINGSAK